MNKTTIDIVLGGAWLLVLIYLIWVNKKFSHAQKSWNALEGVLEKSKGAVMECQENLTRLESESQTIIRSLDTKMHSAARLIQDLDFLSHRAQKITDLLEKFSASITAMGKNAQNLPKNDTSNQDNSKAEENLDEDPRNYMNLR